MPVLSIWSPLTQVRLRPGRGHLPLSRAHGWCAGLGPLPPLPPLAAGGCRPHRQRLCSLHSTGRGERRGRQQQQQQQPDEWGWRRGEISERGVERRGRGRGGGRLLLLRRLHAASWHDVDPATRDRAEVCRSCCRPLGWMLGRILSCCRALGFSLIHFRGPHVSLLIM